MKTMIIDDKEKQEIYRNVKGKSKNYIANMPIYQNKTLLHWCKFSHYFGNND
jgi:hypothetical protein